MRILGLPLAVLAGAAVACMQPAVGPGGDAPVATVTVVLNSSVLVVGQGTQGTATLRDADGNVLAGRDVTWASSNTNVATAATNGYVTAAGTGSATISATSEG